MSLASKLGIGKGPDSVVEEVDGEKTNDVESLKASRESIDRPLYFISAIFVGLAMCLILILLFGFGGSAVRITRTLCQFAAD
jgi:hypothetical protein